MCKILSIMYRMLELFSSPTPGLKDEGTLQPDNGYNLYEETIELKNNEVETILEEEKNRLNEKNKVIQTILSTKERADGFIRSERLKKQAHTRILITMIFMTIATLLVLFLRKNLPLPDVFFDLVIILIISIGIIRIIWLRVDIYKRDHMNFEKVNFDRLLKVENKPSKNQTIINTELEVPKTACIGHACCKTGHFFVDNKCQLCPASQRYDENEKKCISY